MVGKQRGWINDEAGHTLVAGAGGWVVLVATVGVMAAYVMFATRCPSKPECNSVHAVSSLALILAYVVARNLWSGARAVQSELMGQAGRVSLELFLGQYHIWLAMDTKGILTLIPGWWLLNAVCTTIVFVHVANHLSDTFNYLTGVLVPKDNLRAALQRLAVLLAAVLLTFALMTWPGP